MARLSVHRGIAQLTALTLAAEIVDRHRFPAARAFMGFAGLVSSGTRTRRGTITKGRARERADRAVESAWSYRHRPAIGATIRRRQDGLPPDTLAWSWKTRQRLHATGEKMNSWGRPQGVTATTVARELCQRKPNSDQLAEREV